MPDSFFSKLIYRTKSGYFLLFRGILQQAKIYFSTVLHINFHRTLPCQGQSVFRNSCQLHQLSCNFFSQKAPDSPTILHKMEGIFTQRGTEYLQRFKYERLLLENRYILFIGTTCSIYLHFLSTEALIENKQHK